MFLLAKLIIILSKIINRLSRLIMISLFKRHGKNVVFFPLYSFFSYNTIEFGDDVYIGPGANFSSITKITIGNKVMFGPNVTIMGGDHNTTEIGKFMFDVTSKNPENDLPVVIEDDVWIGTGVIILKGVTIGKGSIIAAGALVNKMCYPIQLLLVYLQN